MRSSQARQGRTTRARRAGGIAAAGLAGIAAAVALGAAPVGAQVGPGVEPCAGADVALTGSNVAQVRLAVLCLVNNERVSRGIPALTADARLDVASQQHAEDMVARDYFAHASLDGRTPPDRAQAAGYPSSFVGENIAYGNTTARETVAQWLKSDGHCRNFMSSRYQHLGVGAAPGAPSGAMWVQNFGATAVQPTSPASTTAAAGCPYAALVATGTTTSPGTTTTTPPSTTGTPTTTTGTTPTGATTPTKPPTTTTSGITPTTSTTTSTTTPSTPPKPGISARAVSLTGRNAGRFKVTGFIGGGRTKVRVTVRRAAARPATAKAYTVKVRRGVYSLTAKRPSGRGKVLIVVRGIGRGVQPAITVRLG
ncbi:sporulation protein [Paraconexibacter sp. AEG42_29]|uniref:Sporulation protein n=1 Tax=Paraconexibacter sp. AEG42_29 TaxID=2997339 RepID=A0AAU7AWX0_9ACTN